MSSRRTNYRSSSGRAPRRPAPKGCHWSALIILLPAVFILLVIVWPQKRKAPPPAVFTPSAALENGDFEASSPAPWHALEGNIQWGSFSVGTETLPDGKTNQFAKVSAEVASPPIAVKVFGAVQELRIESGLPEKLQFRCRIAQEKSLCSKQYAQAVAIFTPNSAKTGNTNVQLRHILHGLSTPPYQMSNARFIMNPSFTLEGEWRHYDLPLRESFARQYPGFDFTKGTLRLLFEARYDDIPATATPGDIALEVHYDSVQAKLP